MASIYGRCTILAAYVGKRRNGTIEILLCQLTNFFEPMPSALASSAAIWPWWRKLLFRFSSVYLLLYLSPWGWLNEVPVLSTVAEYFGAAENRLVNLGNTYLFHVKDVLVPINGSGDTSYGYAQLCLFMLVAVIGTMVWTLLDWRKNYTVGYYWLLVLVRYFVAMTAFSYGIIKLFGQQMIFPTLSALATPLGNFLPMRLSWFFIGYSAPYQFFSGAAETMAAVLLLFRRTSTLGALMAAGVFLNVMMLNLCYDIPVKIFSIHLFALSCFLVLGDAQRLFHFFVLNRPTQPATLMPLPSWRWRVTQLTLKVIFVGLFVLLPFYAVYQSRAASQASSDRLTTGFFVVEQFRGALADSLRWKDVIFETTKTGSVQTADTMLRQRYGRGYFTYSLDLVRHTIVFKRRDSDTVAAFTLRYTMPDTSHIVLQGKIRQDSVTIALKRQPRHFQLAERQFHWLSESNR